MKNMVIYTQPKPQMQDSKNIISFSCGNSHTVAVDSSGYGYSLGSN
jgi:alpha-tubulin suppressor-like RCC1 family protein